MSLPLLHSPAEILREVLVGLDVGGLPTAVRWPLFVGNEPSDPDDCLTLYDVQGTDDGRSMLDGELYVHSGFQLRLRSRDYPTGFAKASDSRRTLAESILRIIVAGSGLTYLLHAITRLSDVISLGKEVPSSKRYLFVINGTLALRRLN